MSKKINDLTQLTTPAKDDLLVARDTSAGSTKKLTIEDLFATPGLMTLGYAEITADFNSSSTTGAQVTGLSVTVVIPAGSRRIEIIAFTGYSGVASGTPQLQIWDGSVGSGTQIGVGQGETAQPTGAGMQAIAIKTPSAGSKTYNVGLRSTAGASALLGAAPTAPAFLLVRAI